MRATVSCVAVGSRAAAVTTPPATPAGALVRAKNGDRVRAARRDAALALCGFTLLSCLVFGRGVLFHLGSTLVGSGQSPAFAGRDQGAFTWFLAWGAYVL